MAAQFPVWTHPYYTIAISPAGFEYAGADRVEGNRCSGQNLILNLADRYTLQRGKTPWASDLLLLNL